MKISNLYCPENQRQVSENNEIGNISYIDIDDKNFEKIFNDIKMNNGLIYIRKRDSLFDTRQRKNIMPKYLKEILLEKKPQGDDEDAYIYEKEIELENILLENRNIKYNFLEKYNIGNIPKQDFYYLKNQMIEKRPRYVVFSIDKVKGLESEDCMFIVNKSMLDYLLKKKTDKNKELNYLYVALTRTKKNLILAINIKEGKDEVIGAIEKLGIKKYKDEI